MWRDGLLLLLGFALGAALTRRRPDALPGLGRAVRGRVVAHPAGFVYGVGLVLVCMVAGLFVGPLLSGGDGTAGGRGAGEDGRGFFAKLRGEDEDRASLRSARRKVRRDQSIVARARGASVPVYASRSARRPRTRVAARVIEGQRVPLVFLVRRRGRTGRLEVHLPVRPNLSTGWIRRRDVTLSATAYRVRVELRRHRLTVWRGSKRIVRKPIGTGQAVSPTPRGRYFVTDLIRARNPADVYGPYAFGLSGHSNVYTSFRGGTGQIGLHGTNDPGALGADVSAGCIRVDNRTITALARILPLGTPVDIRR